MQKYFKMEKKEKVQKSLILDKDIFDEVLVAAKKDTRSINKEIQVLIVEALEARKNTEKQ